MAETGLKQVWTGAVTRIDLTDLEGVGQYRFESGKIYKYIKYNNGAGNIEGILGRVVGYRLLDGYKTNIVTMDSSDHIGSLAAGVLAASLQDGNFGWVQIKGAATVTNAAVAGSDGDPLTLVGATADVGDLDVNIATAANAHICAWAGDISDDEIVCDFPF